VKNNIKLISSAIAITIGLSACQSNKEIGIMDKPEVVYKYGNVNEQIAKIPNWYLQVPSDDDTIYSSGSAKAPDLQLAVDIAIMNAKTTLADRINGKLDSMTKSFVAKIGSDDMDTSVLNEIEKVSKNVIASVDVAGYKIDKSDITQEGTQFRAYVLLAYNNEEAQKVMMNRLKRDRMIYSRIRSTEAWKELEREVEKSKEEDEAKSMENIERLIDENNTSI
tara:strand:- start:1085 stop:1750 length:666 start_codon:yes stop_codon:yes gene_type:complete